MKGDEFISLQLVGSYLSIFPPLWCFLLSDGEEFPSIMAEALDDREKWKNGEE